MEWSDDEAREEFRRLSFMSAYKYDGYRDYIAGARFIENLATWLQQFSSQDRPVAYEFVKEKLIYFSAGEIQRLVEKFFPEFVQGDLVQRVSERLGIPAYKVWASEKSIEEYQVERRKTIFMGLSDGARIDALRRANPGSISNDQVVIATQIDDHKWSSLLDDLHKDLKKIRNGDMTKEKFSRVYLIDDFTASGTSLIRDPDANGTFKGKLAKFAESLAKVGSDGNALNPFCENFDITVHHYIGTEKAENKISEVYSSASSWLANKGLPNITFSYGMMLSSGVAISSTSANTFGALCESYYDTALEGNGEHGGQSGTTDKMFGYAGCGLPVVLEHNAPNNSLPLLWAATDGNDEKHRMRPLFRRRERHSDMGGNER